MEIIIFIFYLVACCYIVSRFPFLQRSGLGKWTLIGLFVLKVLAGIAYALFYRLPRYYENSDSWRFYRLSLAETKWLLSDPIAFFKDIFTYGYSSGGNLFIGRDSYWNDLKSNIPVKLMAMMNVITHNNYYADIILFNLLFFVGMVALFRLVKETYRCPNWLLIAAIFFVPSTLFWCSGIHKDGLMLSSTGLLLYCIYQLFTVRSRPAYYLVVLVCFALIFALRNYVALALIPALFAWWLSLRKPRKTAFVFGSTFVACVLLFVVSFFLPPPFHLPSYIANKQREFQGLPGASAIEVTPLQPTISSFISYLPTAVDMAALRPHITEIKNRSYIPAACENLLVLLILLVAIIRIRRSPTCTHSLFFLFFAFTLILIAGYTVTFSGSIVRYRSFWLPFLLIPAVVSLANNRNAKQI